MAKKRRWSSADDERLEQMLGGGATWHEIAEAFGRSMQSVRMRAYRNRFRESHRRPWTPEEDERLLDLRGSGSRWIDIAEALGRSPASCEGRVRRLGADPGDDALDEPRGRDYLLMIRLESGHETAIARGPEAEVRGIYGRMSRTVEGLWVMVAPGESMDEEAA